MNIATSVCRSMGSRSAQKRCMRNVTGSSVTISSRAPRSPHTPRITDVPPTANPTPDSATPTVASAWPLRDAYCSDDVMSAIWPMPEPTKTIPNRLRPISQSSSMAVDHGTSDAAAERRMRGSPPVRQPTGAEPGSAGRSDAVGGRGAGCVLGGHAGRGGAQRREDLRRLPPRIGERPGAGVTDRRPDALGRAGHVDVAHTEMGESVDHGVLHRRCGADGGGLADALR